MDIFSTQAGSILASRRTGVVFFSAPMLRECEGQRDRKEELIGRRSDAWHAADCAIFKKASMGVCCGSILFRSLVGNGGPAR